MSSVMVVDYHIRFKPYLYRLLLLDLPVFGEAGKDRRFNTFS